MTLFDPTAQPSSGRASVADQPPVIDFHNVTIASGCPTNSAFTPFSR